MTRIILIALAATVQPALSLPAQSPAITINPAHPAPGAVVRVSFGGGFVTDSIVSVSGSIAGEPLHFRRNGSGMWRSIAGIPVDSSGDVAAFVVIEQASGVTDTVRSTVRILSSKPGKGRPRTLSVSSRFTRPLDSATQARVDLENEKAREIGRRAHDSPRMWTAPFLRPRPSAVTSMFGSGRMFNGTLSSRHLGVDFRGATGAPVHAANRGLVALVDEFFLAGNVIYIDHGGGVVTGYFHLSETLVSAGDTVVRGQEIGRVGATGRVTGPHLHWTARYGAVTVNPLDLVALPAGWY
ncbi:MAG TPA: M23 family metallopeptidase [Gemmatimonadaceae bacterium]|nr:M23 family metallopeptidase [Gemmatimonadaceae bacterium]